jgi:hypothetical protein
MAYVFVSLIVLFAGASIVYLVANDFAKETLEVLFPAMGAILLSGYLGFKSIVLDAPEPKRFGTSIAVLHDSINGQIYGMAPRSIKHLPKFNEFRGANAIDTLSLYNAFKDINISETLKDVSDDPNSPSNVLIEQLLEYSLLQWLCNPDVSIGYYPGPTTQLITGAGGGGSLSGNLVGVPVTGGVNQVNPFLKALPLTIPLPEGSTVVHSNDRRLSFEIDTHRTKLHFRYAGGGRDTLDTPIGQDVERIYSALGLGKKVQGLRMQAFNLEITATQNPFLRYSKQSKSEVEWINRMHTQFEKDFSWERLRAFYTAD